MRCEAARALAAVVASEACLAFVDARFAFAAAEAPARFAPLIFPAVTKDLRKIQSTYEQTN